jgi:hypothetical protein
MDSKDTYFRFPTPAEAAAAVEVAVPRAPRLSRRSLVPALCWLAGGLFFRFVVGWHGDLTRSIIILAAIVALASFGRYVMKISDYWAKLRDYRLRRAEQACR